MSEQIIATANQRATEMGVNFAATRITITQGPDRDETVWRVNYGAKNYLRRRGGDIIIDVSTRDMSIQSVMHGQ